jgi:hypothetical protein
VETSGGDSENFQKTGCKISLMAAVQTGSLAPVPDHKQQQQQQQQQINHMPKNNQK